jgi:hypothetical protein
MRTQEQIYQSILADLDHIDQAYQNGEPLGRVAYQACAHRTRWWYSSGVKKLRKKDTFIGANRTITNLAVAYIEQGYKLKYTDNGVMTLQRGWNVWKLYITEVAE